jgi:hypothetical protein
VEKVLSAIQKQVMSFSLRGRGAASVSCSYLGSSWISEDSRGSTLSTRPSVEGRDFSAIQRSANVVSASWSERFIPIVRCG